MSFAHPHDVKRAAAAFAEGKVGAAAVVGEKSGGGDDDDDDDDGNGSSPPRPPFPVPCFEAHIPYALQFKADCGLAGMDIAEFERGRVRGGWPRSGPRRKWWQKKRKEEEEEEEEAEEEGLEQQQQQQQQQQRLEQGEGEKRLSLSSPLVWTSGSPHAASWELPGPAGCGRGGRGPPRVSKEGLGRGDDDDDADDDDSGHKASSSSLPPPPSVIEVDVTADAIANAKAEAARRVPLESVPGLFDEEGDEEEEEPVDESGQCLGSHVAVAVLLIGPPLHIKEHLLSGGVGEIPLLYNIPVFTT